MKGILTLSFLLALLTHSTAQTSRNTNDTTRRVDFYYILTAGIGKIWYPQLPGDMTIRFPYTVQPDGTNLIAKKTFTGTLPKFYERALMPLDLATVEFLVGPYGIRMGVGLIANPAGEEPIAAYWRQGFSYSIPLRVGPRKGAPHLFFKPALDALIVMSTGGNTLGSISNGDATVVLPGLTSESQFTVQGNDETQGGTYNTKYLNVNFVQDRILLLPKLSLAWQPKGIFYCSVDAGWEFPVFLRQKLEIFQEDGSGDSQDLGSILLRPNLVSVELNNQPVAKASPVGGPFLGINVGIVIPHYWKKTSHSCNCPCGNQDEYYGSPGWIPGGGGSGGGHPAPVAPSGGGGHHG